jgi:phage repressor protein C with HTH and peptisase S24 domain
MAREKIANALKMSREKAGLTCDEVGKLIGKSPKTVNAWENNRGQPDADAFMLLCKIYNVTDIMTLFGEEIANTNKETLVLAEEDEINLMTKYRPLPARAKEIVNTVVSMEHTRYEQDLKAEETHKPQTPGKIKHFPKNEEPDDTEEEEYEKVVERIYLSPAVMGSGGYIDEYTSSNYEDREFPADEVPRRASFGIIVIGDSMEPTLHSGEIAWIEALAKPENGDIGVFIYRDPDDGEEKSYCKEISIERDGRNREIITLISHNPESKDIPIKYPEFLRSIGRVIL